MDKIDTTLTTNKPMLILKQTPTERIVMYGYEPTYDTISALISRLDIEGIVPVYKREWLLEQPEDFWKDLVEPFNAPFECYKYYDESDPEGWMYFCNAKSSGHSALSQVKGEYILIVWEGLK